MADGKGSRAHKQRLHLLQRTCGMAMLPDPLLDLQPAKCSSPLCLAGATTWTLQAQTWLKAWKT